VRIAIVFFPDSHRNKLLELSKGLARGIEAQGHQVDIVDGARDVNTKLTIYEYIAVGTEQTNLFGGKIPAKVGEYLKNAGIVGGKKSFAFVLKRPLGTSKSLRSLMSTMESEGMFLRVSDVLISPEGAEAVGKRLKIS
jgi:hypothetical protein